MVGQLELYYYLFSCGVAQGSLITRYGQILQEAQQLLGVMEEYFGQSQEVKMKDRVPVPYVGVSHAVLLRLHKRW
jgi:hypothetical protein